MVHIINATLETRNPVTASTAMGPAHGDVEGWSKYGFVSTQDVIDVCAQQGWVPTSQTAIATRNEQRRGFQKHMVRLSHPEISTLPGLSAYNRSRPELVIVNSHDGSSAIKIMWGLFRMACLNGCISGDALSSVVLHHRTGIHGRLTGAIQGILESFPAFATQVQTLQQTTLSKAAVEQMVKTVYDARLSDVKNVRGVDYTIPALRVEDDGQDAFSVFNRVQEKVIKGGIQYDYARQITNDAGVVVTERPASAVTRALKSVPEQLRLNRLAYDTALALV